MSKAKGNIVDPLDLIDGVDLATLVAKRTEGMMQPHLKARAEQLARAEFPDGIPAFGTDAVRLTFASLATMGREIRLDFGRTDGYHRFCNKLWNASQYVFTQLSKATSPTPTPTSRRWPEPPIGRRRHSACSTRSAPSPRGDERSSRPTWRSQPRCLLWTSSRPTPPTTPAGGVPTGSPAPCGGHGRASGPRARC